MASSCFVIAEAGINHNGNRDFAFQLVDAAIEAGADAVKFQTYITEHLVARHAPKAEYQKKTGSSHESQYEMLKKMELSCELYHQLLAYCKHNKIVFLSTAFDFESLNFLSRDLSLKTLKISSGDITNGPFLLSHAMTGCDIILSTGMATLAEIEQALAVIAYGFLPEKDRDCKLSYQSFFRAYCSEEGQRLLEQKVTLLHCTTEYPAPVADVNLNAIDTLRKSFKLKTGFSDHSEGIVIPIAAVSLGADIIEKHFTLDRNLPGPDHKASLEPLELKKMIAAVRIVEKALGNGLKHPAASEMANRDIARKSILASVDIKAGELFSETNITVKRPGFGKSPMEFWRVLGTKSLKDYCAEEFI